MRVSKWNYGRYSSNNYGANTIAVGIAGATFFFSYNTVVAFYDPQKGRVACENIWSPTTGKHLNWIEPDHDARLPVEEFNAALEELLDVLDIALDKENAY